MNYKSTKYRLFCIAAALGAFYIGGLDNANTATEILCFIVATAGLTAFQLSFTLGEEQYETHSLHGRRAH